MNQVYRKPKPAPKPKLSKSIEGVQEQLDMFHSVAKLFEDHPKVMKGLTAFAIGAAVLGLLKKSND